MRIGILSDTHDQVRRTERAVALLMAEGAEALIHCGDYTTPEVVFACTGLPGYFVLGNSDFDEDDLRRAMTAIGGTYLGPGGELALGGRRIAVTHGDSSRMMRHLALAGPDYLLFGHSHVPTDGRDGTIRLINPGALHRARAWTVALLDTDMDALKFVNVR
jgi:putative phosphoesterase